MAFPSGVRKPTIEVDADSVATTLSTGPAEQRVMQDDDQQSRHAESSRKGEKDLLDIGDRILDDSEGDEDDSAEKRAEKFLKENGWNAQQTTDGEVEDPDVRRANFKRSSVNALESAFTAIRAEEAAKQNPWLRFKADVFGIIPSQPGLRGSRLIHPLSPFGQFIVIISTIFLMYTALVVPVVIAFKWDEPDPCWRNPLLELDMVVDTFFIIEICLHFVTGIFHKGIYRDDWNFVSRNYIHGGLGFDVLTSVPLSYVEYVILLSCNNDDGAGSSDISKFRFTRLIKPFRIIRMARVLRAMKTVDISTTVERWLHIPPIFSRLLRVLFTIMAVTHLTASFFWLVKVSAVDREGIYEFLEGNGLPGNASFLQKYILSVYFVQTVFTTVGFGDVHATNTAEQVVCIIIMLMGVMVFGTLLAEVESGLAEMRLLVRERNQFLHRLKNFLRDKGVPLDLERRILDWVDFDFEVEQQQKRVATSVSHLHPDLKRELEVHMLEGKMEQVAFLDIQHPQDEDLQMDVFRQGEPMLFPKGSVVYDSEEAASHMLIVQQGTVRVSDKDDASVAVLQIGDVIGAWNLLGEHDPQGHFGIPVLYRADSHVHCIRIDKDAFEAVLAAYPEDVSRLVHGKFEARRASTIGLQNQSFISRKYQIAAAKWTAIVSKKLRKHQRQTQKGGAFGATGMDLLKGIQRKSAPSSPLPAARSPGPRGFIPGRSQPGSPPPRGSPDPDARFESSLWRDTPSVSNLSLRPASSSSHPAPPIPNGLWSRLPPETDPLPPADARLAAVEGKLAAVSGDVGGMRTDLQTLQGDVASLLAAVASLTQAVEAGRGAQRRPEEEGGDRRARALAHHDGVPVPVDRRGARPGPQLAFGNYKVGSYEEATKVRRRRGLGSGAPVLEEESGRPGGVAEEEGEHAEELEAARSVSGEREGAVPPPGAAVKVVRPLLQLQTSEQALAARVQAPGEREEAATRGGAAAAEGGGGVQGPAQLRPGTRTSSNSTSSTPQQQHHQHHQQHQEQVEQPPPHWQPVSVGSPEAGGGVAELGFMRGGSRSGSRGSAELRGDAAGEPEEISQPRGEERAIYFGQTLVGYQHHHA